MFLVSGFKFLTQTTGLLNHLKPLLCYVKRKFPRQTRKILPII